ncbi:hypothetical protein JOC85_000552 [Bacillus mesophilus]|uniref:DUF3813 domain-containing protein n=1 Tax=Bacillus mesophilus TaxID=1808955 RepID=A0A6M0Q375_9BACI|nr:DUF3813 domain-containing protein [Bacillus mesophilus]MBM7659785.1 hypothetical protein [Bacillus mesophilus]NEY70644.1 DUF3813 domain-containing protein [Bacillus mesophilus]
MANQLFQKARETVAIAKQASNGNSSTDVNQAIDIAKNALSSAYANSTVAEQEQLRVLQDELDQIQSR